MTRVNRCATNSWPARQDRVAGAGRRRTCGDNNRGCSSEGEASRRRRGCRKSSLETMSDPTRRGGGGGERGAATHWSLDVQVLPPWPRLDGSKELLVSPPDLQPQV